MLADSRLNLFILPGLDGTGIRLGEFVRRLGPHVATRVVGYPCDEPLGYADLERLIRAALPTDRRFVLLGESFSGPLAIRIAADPPPHLAGLILCGTFARNPYPWLRWARPLAVRFPVKSLPRWLRAPLLWGSADPRSAPVRRMRATSSVATPVIRHRIGEILAVDETRSLARVRTPTLILTARSDRLVPRSAISRLLRGLPGAHVEEIDGPHLLLQVRPGECAHSVLRFLRRCN
ncbi:MAG TPA: alpha/beta fold hydrolase [Steroidobacteraceae bacterium]|nr:alpha/beta fold hydrolase [Steroidobacteraceae bacterium]